MASVFGKVKDIEVRDKQFTNQDTGEIAEYKRLILTVQIDGKDEELEFQAPKNDKSLYRVLQLADDVE